MKVGTHRLLAAALPAALAAALAGLGLAGCAKATVGQPPASPLPSPTSVANPAQQLPLGRLTVAAPGKGGHTRLALSVQIAATDQAQEIGLMNVTSMPAADGMAFTWTTPTDTPFWMQDTLIPLDIVFWDASGKVVTVLTMVPCTANPCHLYYPTANYVGAVEMNAGLTNQYGVAPGDTVKLVR